MRRLTTIHFPTDDTLCVLHGDSALGIRDEHDEDHDCQDADNQQKRGVPLERAVCKAGNHRAYELRDTGDDTGKEDHRDAVADAELVDLLAHPHQEGRACRKGQDDHETVDKAGLVEQAVVLEHHIICKAHEHAQTDGRVTGDVLDLLAAFLTVFLCQAFQSRNRDGQKLDDNGGVDIGLNTECKHGSLRECRARHRIVKTENGVCQLLREVVVQRNNVDIGNGDAVAKPIDQHHDQREDDLFAKLGNFPGVTECSKHLHHLGLSACLFDFFLGRLGESSSLHRDVLRHITVAENLQAILAVLQDALGDQSGGVDDRTVFELVENRNVHSRQRLREDVVEAALRDAACQRHLTAFKADAELAARTSLLTLVSAACRLAVARCRAAALALIDMGGTHNRSKFV